MVFVDIYWHLMMDMSCLNGSDESVGWFHWGKSTGNNVLRKVTILLPAKWRPCSRQFRIIF